MRLKKISSKFSDEEPRQPSNFSPKSILCSTPLSPSHLSSMAQIYKITVSSFTHPKTHLVSPPAPTRSSSALESLIRASTTSLSVRCGAVRCGGVTVGTQRLKVHGEKKTAKVTNAQQ